MVVRTVGRDTQIDVYRDFNVADAAALVWTHCFTVLIRLGLSVQGWAHEAGAFNVNASYLNGETEPVWGGTVGWGAGRVSTESADNFLYVADFKVLV
jgi:hypothetical protein